ncbi:ATP-dependent metallopeptidase FtsH/Yme1/Tma family protein, partial [Methylocucumis oryzae]
MKDKSTDNDILQMLVSMLSAVYSALKQGLTTLYDYFFKPEPDVELHKPQNSRITKRWRAALFVMLVMVLISLFNTMRDMQRDEIPYSEFIKQLKAEKIEKAIVTERYISGVFKSEQAETQGRPFVTVPLWQSDLAKLLQENNVDFVVRSGESWITSLLFNWIIPILILVAIWSWVIRRTSGMQRGFLNIGNKAHIHPDSLPKVT